MKRLILLFALLSLLAAAPALAATEVRMTGDARIHGNYWSHYAFTGWNQAATRTAEPFAIFERFRLRSDFTANEAVKFRFGIRVNNIAWGNSAFTVDNPAVVIDIYQAYLQFIWPGTKIEFTIGQQDINLPISGDILSANPVLGGIRGAGAVVTIPVVDDKFGINAAFFRFVDANGAFDPTTTQVPDEFDAYFMALPVTLDGFTATPWAMLGVVGRAGNYTTIGTGGAGTNQTLASNLYSAGSALTPAGQRQAQDLYWWLGGSFSVTALDPFKFYADVIYGQGAQSERGKNHRGGLFFDAAAEYTGLNFLTPQLAFWYATGEDGSTRNGSERMPVITSAWGAGNSFLFDSTQEYSRGFLGVDYLGSWGFIASLDKISFIEDLASRVTFTYAKGLNSPTALRNGVALWGYANYFEMGRELATTEYVVAVNVDNQYNIYQNLALIMETGWSHGSFDRSVWGRRLVNQAESGDAWKFSLGFRYKF